MNTPMLKYERRKSKYDLLLKKQTKYINIISNLRLAVFIFEVILCATLYFTHNFILLFASIPIFLVAFVFLIVNHKKFFDNKNFCEKLSDINDMGIKRLKGEWRNFTDIGTDFVDINHVYAQDLDIFGQSSVFQWINTANTYYGRKSLAKTLLGNFDKNIEEIYSKQESVSELALKIKWRSYFMSEALLGKGSKADPKELLEWAIEKGNISGKSWLKIIIRILPILSVSSILSYFLFKIPVIIPLISLIINFSLIKYNLKKSWKVFSVTEKYKDVLKIYYKMMKRYEDMEFSSKYVQNLKKKMYGESKDKAYKQVDKLSKIMERAANRHNALFFVFNVILLWDYQCLLALEEWKLSSGKYIKTWLEILGEMEALSSLSIIPFENPKWGMPEFKENLPELKAKNMGHPLISETRVSNDIDIQKPSGILLITGSNMSGKSTFLRTAGINLVLAYTGAPVCALNFRCSIMDIHTCMRVNDKLEGSISSFYAELLRIKMIVNAVKQKRPVFFLLDEIFKGTNSKDRHLGAKILIKRFSEYNILGLVSTHDLELGELETETNNKVLNYHFREFYKEDKLFFDYKLKTGVSTTRNAMYLMKLAGIDLDE